MKTQSSSLFAQIGIEQLEKLTAIVDETIATGFNQPQSKKFTSADLWNIQRQGNGRIRKGLLV